MTVEHGPNDGATSQCLVKETLLEMIIAVFARDDDQTIFDACWASVVDVDVCLLSFTVKG